MKKLIVIFCLLFSTSVFAQDKVLDNALAQAQKNLQLAQQALTKTPEYQAYENANKLFESLKALKAKEELAKKTPPPKD